MITDKLAGYGAAQRAVMPAVERRQHKGLNTCAANAHQPIWPRERQIKHFKSARQAQRPPSTQDQTNNLSNAATNTFRLINIDLPAREPSEAWAEISGVAAAA